MIRLIPVATQYDLNNDCSLNIVVWQCVLQVEGWIDDKLKIAYEDDFQDVTDLIDKMKKLQKHQAFEAEIVANTDRIKHIKEVSF